MKTNPYLQILPIIFALLCAGCVTTQARSDREPSIMAMTMNEVGWFRCLIIKKGDVAIKSWSVSPNDGITAKDDIRIERYLSINEFEALSSLIQSDPRILKWKRVDEGNYSLDHGIIITFRNGGDSSGSNLSFDITPEPDSTQLLDDLKKILGYQEIEEYVKNRN